MAGWARNRPGAWRSLPDRRHGHHDESGDVDQGDRLSGPQGYEPLEPSSSVNTLLTNFFIEFYEPEITGVNS